MFKKNKQKNMYGEKNALSEGICIWIDTERATEFRLHCGLRNISSTENLSFPRLFIPT